MCAGGKGNMAASENIEIQIADFRKKFLLELERYLALF